MASHDILPFVEHFYEDFDEEVDEEADQATVDPNTPITLRLAPTTWNTRSDENPHRTKKPRTATNCVDPKASIEAHNKQRMCAPDALCLLQCASSSARIHSRNTILMASHQSTLDAAISTSTSSSSANTTIMSYDLATGEATKTTTSRKLFSEDDNMVRAILEFVGPGHFRFVAGTNRQFCKVYTKILLDRGGDKVSTPGTSWHSIVESVSRLKLYLEEDTTYSAQQPTRNRRICRSAAADGRLEVLKWARKNGCDWDYTTCANAALNGHLEVLKWARQNGCDWNEWTCSNAAANGHLNVLQWARQNGCYWTERTCSDAAANGHLEVLMWTEQNGCDCDAWTCTDVA